MAIEKGRSLELSNNAFGKLVKTFRVQWGWSQGQLAEKWELHENMYHSLSEAKGSLINKSKSTVWLISSTSHRSG
jgi:ribosome-binding protein aMBF1 (putative translation factor)